MAKSSSAKQLVKKTVRPKRSGQIPVTAKMLQKTRAELKSDITTLRLETRAGFKKVDARFDKMEERFCGIDARFDTMEARFSGIDARFDKMEARFSGIDARFDKMEARFSGIDARFNRVDARFDTLEAMISGLQASIHRMQVLIEEQNARNVYVLDGYASLDARLKVLEGS